MKALSRENCRKARIFKNYSKKEVAHEIVWVHCIYVCSYDENVDGTTIQRSECMVAFELPSGDMDTIEAYKIQFIDLE